MSEFFQPSYQPMTGERWEMRVGAMVICPGYWSPPRLVTDMAALVRREDDGSLRTWMSMTPMEIESQELGCQFAVGDTVVMGLGMGWAAANAALRPEVTRVTVVEKDPEIRDIVSRLGVFAQLPPEAAAKIAVVAGDAYEYRPDRPADTLLADIWRPLFGAERDTEVRRMRDNCGASLVYFWGQEMVIADRARKAGKPVDAGMVAEIVAEMDLPLIGPDLPDYPDLIARAAARWLQ